MRTDSAANTEPCDGQSYVRTLHPRRSDDYVRHQAIQEEVCDVSSISSSWATLNGKQKINIAHPLFAL